MGGCCCGVLRVWVLKGFDNFCCCHMSESLTVDIEDGKAIQDFKETELNE